MTTIPPLGRAALGLSFLALLGGCVGDAAKPAAPDPFVAAPMARLLQTDDAGAKTKWSAATLGQSLGLDASAEVCSKPGGTNAVFGPGGTAALFLLVAEKLVAGVFDVAGKVVDERIKTYATSGAFSVNGTLPDDNGTILFCRKVKTDGPDKPWLALQPSAETDASGRGVTLKLRPVWFDPLQFRPQRPADGAKNSEGKAAKVTFSVHLTPVYFQKGERRPQAKTEVLTLTLTTDQLTKMSGDKTGVSVKTDAIPLEALPRYAFPPNRYVTFDFAVAAAGEVPASLTALKKLLADQKDSLTSEAKTALEALLNKDGDE